MSASISKTEWEQLSKKQMKPWVIRDEVSTHKPAKGQVLVHCRPIVTNKGRQMLELQANAYLDESQVSMLISWLRDWQGHQNRQKADALRANTIKWRNL